MLDVQRSCACESASSLHHSSWLFCCVPENVIGLERRGSSLTHSERASTQRKPCLNGTSVHTTAAIPDAIDSAHVTGSAEVSTLSSCAHCKQRRHACAVAATPQPAAPTHRTLCRVLFHMCKNLSPKALHHPHASTWLIDRWVMQNADKTHVLPARSCQAGRCRRPACM